MKISPRSISICEQLCPDESGAVESGLACLSFPLRNCGSAGRVISILSKKITQLIKNKKAGVYKLTSASAAVHRFKLRRRLALQRHKGRHVTK